MQKNYCNNIKWKKFNNKNKLSEKYKCECNWKEKYIDAWHSKIIIGDKCTQNNWNVI